MRGLYFKLRYALEDREPPSTRQYHKLLPAKPADPVCDTCVEDYMEAGMLVELGDFLHDKVVAETLVKVGILKKA